MIDLKTTLLYQISRTEMPEHIYSSLEEIFENFELQVNVEMSKERESEILEIFNSDNPESLSLDYENDVLLYWLGIRFEVIEPTNIKKMEKYYKLCAKTKTDFSVDSMKTLAGYYDYKGYYGNMEKYYLMAIEKGDAASMYYLGNYYEEEKLYTKAKEYYSMSLEKEYVETTYDVGEYYEFVKFTYKSKK